MRTQFKILIVTVVTKNPSTYQNYFHFALFSETSRHYNFSSSVLMFRMFFVFVLSTYERKTRLLSLIGSA